MVTFTIVMQVKILHKQGESKRTFAKERGGSRSTAKRYRGMLSALFAYTPRPAVCLLLNEWRNYIHQHTTDVRPDKFQ